MLLKRLSKEKKRPHRYRGISQAVALLRYSANDRRNAKEAAWFRASDRGVIVAEKRQWPHAGTSLGTGGGVFFLSSSVLEAFFAWGVDLEG